MSKSLEAFLGYCVVFPFILVHACIGFLLMVALAFVGLTDLTNDAWSDGLIMAVGFPLFIVGEAIWVWMGLSSITWVLTGAGLTPSPPAEFRFTFLRGLRRLAAVICAWLVVYGVLAMVPADRALMLQPLSIFGGSSVPLVTRFLDDSSPRVRRSAIDVLYRIGPPARSSAELIARHLNDPDEQVRLEAHSALRILNPDLLPPE